MGNQKVRKGEEINVEGLNLFLYENQIIEEKNSEVRIEQFSGGYSNLTYSIKVEGKSFVLRRPPFGAIKRGHDMSREYKVLSRLHPFYKKAPQAIIFTENTNVIGSPFYLMEKIEGRIIRPQSIKSLNISATDFKTVSDAWLDTFVELHAVDYRAAGLKDLGKPSGYVERQITNWAKQYYNVELEKNSLANKLILWLKENQPKQYRKALIHNDYKYDNIVYSNDSWNEIKAVLDWEMCTIGDPLMDLGTSLSYWFESDDPDFLKAGLPMSTTAKGNPSRMEIVESYETKTGSVVNHLVFYYAYGLFKISVIAQQIYYRFKKGFTTDERFAHLDKVAVAFINTATRAIEKNRIYNLY